jgi:hypothetical protein
MEQAMTTGNILLILFCLALIANAFALFRHWQALRAFTIVMSNLEASQRQFNEMLQNDQRKTPRPPPPDPSVPFKRA